MEADSPKEEGAMQKGVPKLILFVLMTLLLSSQALAAWDVFSPESPPGVAAAAVCLLDGPCEMNTDIYMNGNTIHNVTVLGLSYTWDDIDNKPPGFADDVDNDTQYTADEVYINLVAQQFIFNEGQLNSTIINLVENGNLSLDWNDLINVPVNLDIDRTDDIITSTLFGGDVSGTYDNINIDSNVIGDSEIDYSEVTISDFTNDANYISVGDNVSDLVNDAGYLTNASLDSLLQNTTVDAYITDLWVNETGDTMTGNLNMSNNSILEVWELQVHNITGFSPVYVDDELIVQDNIVAKGNVTLYNPNETYFIGERFLGNTFEFISPSTGETLMYVSETDHPLWGDDLGDITARTMTIDRLIITGLLNYSNTEPPDYYFSDEEWIYKTNTNGTSFTFNFNGSLLNFTIADTINNASINWTQLADLPDTLDVNWTDDVMIDTLFGGDVNGTYDNLQLQPDVVNDNELNYSDVTLADFTNDNGYVRFGDEIYIYKDNPLSDTVRFNETLLNYTIHQLTGIFEETINITVTGGVGTGTTSDCCVMANEILDVRVTPPTGTSAYRFSANSSVTGEIVDTDRNQHVGVWWVAHRGTVVTDENIDYYITNANTDGVYSVRVRYER